MDIQILKPSDALWMNILSKLSHDIYHLPEYISLEAIRTKTIPEAFLLIDGEKIFFVPYLLRACDNLTVDGAITSEGFDVVSPYGYPGILLSKEAKNTNFPDVGLNAFQLFFRDKGICSAFLRLHPILNDDFLDIFQPNTFTSTGDTVSIDLRLSETQIWTHTRKGHRSTINKCKRMNMTPKMVPFRSCIHEFVDIYSETMNRVGASQSYFSFDEKYFLEMEHLLGDYLHLCIVELDRQIICAGLYTECCGIVQSSIGGTRNEFISASPSTLETDYARFWAKERGNQFLHLGGGVGGEKDSVYNFKAGFSELRHPYLTLRLILDDDQYRVWVDARAKSLNLQAEVLLNSSFFPAYRAI
jgi:hypothetical protein